MWGWCYENGSTLMAHRSIPWTSWWWHLVTWNTTVVATCLPIRFTCFVHGNCLNNTPMKWVVSIMCCPLVHYRDIAKCCNFSEITRPPMKWVLYSSQISNQIQISPILFYLPVRCKSHSKISKKQTVCFLMRVNWVHLDFQKSKS